MKIDVQIDAIKAAPVLTYPWIGINGDGMILLFLSEKEQLCLDDGVEPDEDCNVFELYDNYDPTRFKTYTGKITLQMKV